MKPVAVKDWGKYLILLFFASVPWDVSKVLFPPYESTPESTTTLTFVRIATFLLVAWGGYMFLRDGAGLSLKKLVRTPLAWTAYPLFLAVLISWPLSLQPSTTLAEGLRLVLLWLLGVSMALTVRSERTYKQIWQLIFLMASLTACFALVQYFTGWGIWGGGAAEEGARRVNATFMDPNIFARYLDVSILGSLLLLMWKKFQWRWYVVIGLVLQVAALVVSFSRTGWFIFVLGLAVLAIIHWRKKIVPLMVTIGVLAVGGVGLSFIPAIQSRLGSFLDIPALLGQRTPLIAGGWEMFKDHWLTGIGLGNFRWAIENPYNYVLPDWSYVTRSHTTLVTAGAEMGILGILAMLFFLIWIFFLNQRQTGRMRPYALASWLGIFVIWLSSQGEGRFFEDPMMWAFWGLSLALAWKRWEEEWDE